MNVFQIKDIVNVAYNQAVKGATTTAEQDISFISMGQEILSSSASMDKFTKALIDRIGRTIISVRTKNKKNSTLLRNSFEWGAVLQKIYIEPKQAVENKAWNVGDVATLDPYRISKFEAKQKLFSKLSTWSIEVTIPDGILTTAFSSEEEMASFISGVYSTMEQSMATQLEVIEKLVYSTFIGYKVQGNTDTGEGIHTVALLTSYNAENGTTLTPTQAIKNADFLKYASSKINMYKNFMQDLSTQFNIDGYTRHTPNEYARLTVLSEFATNSKFYLESDIYNKDLVTLPNYEEINFWQAPQDYSFTNTSAISNLKDANGMYLEAGTVVALLSDIDAMATTIDKPKTVSQRNDLDEYTNVSYKANIGYMIDLSENGIVFTLT